MIWFALTALAIGTLVALGVGLVWGLGEVLHILSPVLWPLAVAGVISYLLDPVVDYLEARGMKRTRAITAVFALAVVLLVGMVGSVVPQIISETRDLAEKFPSYADKLQLRVESWVSNPPAILLKFLGREQASPSSLDDTNASVNTSTNLNIAVTVSTNGIVVTTNGVVRDPGRKEGIDRATLQSATGWLTKVLPRVGSWIFGQVTKVAAWFGVLAGLALIPIYAFYFLLEKRAIESRWTDYLPMGRSEFKNELVFIIRSINNYLIVFFRSQVLVAVCDGILYTIGFLIIGLPYAILVGALATFLTMIPFLGAIITCIAALILAFVQYGDWQHPALVIAVFAVVQTLEGLVISPKIMGDRVGLHPLTIIIAVVVGTSVFGGLLGGILAIPFTAAGKVLMFRYVWKKPQPLAVG